VKETLQLRFAGGPEAPGRARTAVKAFNGSLSEVRDTVLLLVSEVVTNSVRHAGAGNDALLELDVEASPKGVRVQVIDKGPGFDPEVDRREPDEEGGFGLKLVHELADRWGVDANGVSRVWFEIDRIDREK
jgi:anti-sigma regulatory factor (Ser/Thr protein kinase)